MTSKLRDKLHDDMESFQPGTKQFGVPPAVILTNPKYARNVGAALRACSCFDVRQLWYTGDRVSMNRKHRLPREERMKGYQDVILRQYDRPFDQFPQGTVPVAVEVSDRAESLVEFEHPENAIYVFGPEDGSLERVTLQHCHRFITIPARHCTNLAAAVYITLFDRMSKRVRAGMELPPTLNESRGFIHDFVDSEIG